MIPKQGKRRTLIWAVGAVLLTGLAYLAFERRGYILGFCEDTVDKRVVLAKGLRLKVVRTDCDTLAKESVINVVVIDRPFDQGTTILRYDPDERMPDPTIALTEAGSIAIGVLSTAETFQKLSRYRSWPISYRALPAPPTPAAATSPSPGSPTISRGSRP